MKMVAASEPIHRKCAIQKMTNCKPGARIYLSTYVLCYGNETIKIMEASAEHDFCPIWLIGILCTEYGERYIPAPGSIISHPNTDPIYKSSALEVHAFLLYVIFHNLI